MYLTKCTTIKHHRDDHDGDNMITHLQTHAYFQDRINHTAKNSLISLPFISQGSGDGDSGDDHGNSDSDNGAV